MLGTLVALALAVPGAVTALFALYLVTLVLAAFRHPGPRRLRRPPSANVVVVVPAHDEAALIARCVRSLRAQAYRPGRAEVVVVADNCADGTAAAAVAAGARVLERHEPAARGKGHALRWGIDRVLAAPDPPDAVVVVDADAVAAPGFLTRLVAAFEDGADAAQGESLLSADASARSQLRAGSFLLCNRVRPAGRAAFGLSCYLTGNGMLLSRALLERLPWDAYSSAEDLEYTLHVRAAGARVAFARGAILLSETAPGARAAAQQQLRWEGGKTHLARTWVPRLVAAGVRRRRPTLLDAAFELALPSLGLLTAAALAGTAATVGLVLAGAIAAWAPVPWVIALTAIPLFVLLGLRAAGAPRSAYRALALAPAVVAHKALGVRRLWRFRADTWVRTERRRGAF